MVQPLMLCLRWTALVALIASTLLLFGCASHTPPAGITAVTPFDVQRYQGQWYEIARLDHHFERGMSHVSATYQPQPDGSVRVLNRGFDTRRSEWREAVGQAQFTGPSDTGSLKVAFFWPFYGGYHVAALDPDYQWALVVGPDRGYCWILARHPQLAPLVQQAIVERARTLGIDTAALIWVSHSASAPRR